MLLRLCAAIVLAGPMFAWATCSPSATMGGTWQFFMGTFSDLDCTITLAANGALTAGTCRDRDSPTGGVVKSLVLNDGSIRVTNACTVTGYFVMTGGLYGPGNREVHIVAARLDATRNLLTGLAVNAFGTDDPQRGLFTMLRY